MVKRHHTKPTSRRRLKVLITLTIGAIVLAVIAWILMSRYEGNDRTLYIPHNADYTEINDSLTVAAGNVGTAGAKLLKWLGSGNPSSYRGAYKLKSGMRVIDIFKMLYRRHQSPVKLTFNNIRTLDQLAERVANVIDVTPDQFLSATDSLLADTPVPQRIGRFIPDTYEFYYTASATKVASRLLAQYDTFWTDSRRSQAAALGLTPDQIAVIASIAEEETNDPAERATVGRLYINRYHRAMPLQADPTVKFAVGDFSLRRITATHLAVNSPYNTYKNVGLPPGPIRMPSPATIDAILSAPANNYLYMCAKEDFSGRHNFTSDYATHRANAARYHKALNSKNIN